MAALTLSACFSLCETSLLSARRHNIISRANKGRRGAKAVLALFEDMDSTLATLLLWNSFSNVVVASAATVLAVLIFVDNEAVLSITSIVTTIVILVFAEITPKAVGVRFSEPIACFAAPILLVLTKLPPIGKLMRLLINFGRYAFGIKGDGKNSRSVVAVNELLAMIHDKNTISEADADQKAMLYRVVGLHELNMRDLMISRSSIEYIDLENSVEQIADMLYKCGRHTVPLCEDGLENIVGMVRVNEILQKIRKGNLTKELLREMATNPVYVPETIDPAKALRETVGLQNQPCIVVDEYGGLIGMVSVADYSRMIFGMGAKRDTNGASENGSEKVVVVGGDELIREVNLKNSLNLPEDEAKTVAGLILEKLGTFPEKTGIKVELDEATLVISKLDELKIKEVEIKLDLAMKKKAQEA